MSKGEKWQNSNVNQSDTAKNAFERCPGFTLGDSP